ncbi:helix-turn-helix domain-containing protein, partial [Candidatus Woesearchaeota archaeon]|nr:helix-turn-helix domain-containing protein [Candidatus Woesearchaeota archaeon]
MAVETLLEGLGLTKSEISVYLALLELGSSTTGKIVDKSGASSSKIYEILDKLIQKGLVSYVLKANIKYFEAAPPKRILDYIEEKKASISKQEEDVK